MTRPSNEYMREYMAGRYEARRTQAIALLGGMCSRCNATEKLDFDHIDSKTKSFNIAKRLASASWKVLEEELAKCQLLCQPCHHAKTAEYGDHRGGHNRINNPEHGTSVMYFREKCRCDICRSWRRTSRRKPL